MKLSGNLYMLAEQDACQQRDFLDFVTPAAFRH
jgi:hypothetical protein